MVFLNEGAYLMNLLEAILVLMVSQKLLICSKSVQDIVHRCKRILNWSKEVHDDWEAAAQRCLDSQLDTLDGLPLLIDILFSEEVGQALLADHMHSGCEIDAFRRECGLK